MDTTRRLACKRCQARKIKCNRVQPCSNCIQGKHNCEYRASDGRKHPVSHKYLGALEARLAWFESLTQNLKKASNEERDKLLAGVTLDDHLEGQNGFDIADSQQQPSSSTGPESIGTPQASSLRSGPQGGLQYHGPTSIYLDADATESPAKEPQPMAPLEVVHTFPSSHFDALSVVRLASSLGVDDDLVRETLPLFFLHQYPLFMFIYREAFLSDYYDNTHGGRYWSYPLLYSMCALGAPHSKRVEVQMKKELLARCAQEILMSHCLTRPSPVTIQALLCLAFHEVGQGNASQGWLFSGMAFRMGQDIGFHQDPTRWILQDRSIVSPEDIEIRRRIYWGSYVADKLISLYLGRPVYLREDDAAVQISTPLPDFPDSHDWFGFSEIATQNAIDLQKPQLTSALKHMVLLGKISQDMMTNVFASTRNGQHSDVNRLNQLGDVNLRLNKWHTSLPDALQWSQWSVNKNVRAHILVLHLYYHAMLLSLNRHFVKPSNGFPHSPLSRDICTSSCSTVAILVRQYRLQHGLKTAPLMLVYALVMAIITQMRILNEGYGSLDFLIKSLDECGRCYKLAAEARSSLATLMNSREAPTAGLGNGSDGRHGDNVEEEGGVLERDNIDTATDEHFDASSLDAPPNLATNSFPELGGLAGDPVLDAENFDFLGFTDVNESFNSWFSIGQMG
ncbi:hypothetical protein BU24DRAFT_418931 [Aaosphaeria arxii CBS 175.79]|uniref:Zn(2)-C6 fungal-type domain-containing protein n=1 Tax=Aaosphaeria arxii CBS 175.79 TaxID=1450172 RepID=A0A6A5Y354_9PLEO|nr:uncharacterized protein BU24DRAFT_418931 [Aaosphaeria arxii CBS 175.79]KAF2019331.1 hypothetical protein BU24DRAFT_418931 [Aaosphaeria arxii CBS 175.79]